MSANYQPAGRCDRCGVRAKVEVILLSGGALLLCGHHYSQHESAIGRLAAVVQLDSAVA